ncbi:MAG: YheC/YheD family protein [Syntrophomonas sp.]|nr:YheC/YheD family protein [Syntrophomonas sp.]
MSTVGKIFIADTLINKLEIPPADTVIVRVGAKTVSSKLVIRDNKLKSYMLSPQLAQTLSISRRKALQIRYDQENKLVHIGPTIGILASSLPNRVEFNPKSMQAELAFLSQISKKLKAQTYFFTPSSIDWTNKTTEGFIYRKSDSGRNIWTSSIYPLPDVIYDRISSRAGEARPGLKKIKNKLMKLPYLKYFNPSFLNKWKVHRLLIANPELMPYLPETYLLQLSSLKEMLIKYKTLFLKPCNGSQGYGIIKITSNNKGKLQYIVYGKGKYSGQADSIEDFMKRTRADRKGRSYVVQQGLNLATYKESPFDIRIIYQKNNEGEWKITKKFVRVAARGSSVANLSRGGKPETSKTVLWAIFKKNKMIINEKNDEIRNLCYMAATTLESSSNKLYGELGLDIGIDKNGNLWLIEINSKPRKTTESQLSQQIVHNSFQRPLQYAIYLAGFKTDK